MGWSIPVSIALSHLQFVQLITALFSVHSTSSSAPTASQKSYNSSINLMYRRYNPSRPTSVFGSSHFVEPSQKSTNRYLNVKYGLISLFNRAKYFYNKHFKAKWLLVFLMTLALCYGLYKMSFASSGNFISYNSRFKHGGRQGKPKRVP